MALPDYVARLGKSQKFRTWRPESDGRQGENHFACASVQKYLSLSGLAKAWGVDPETIRHVVGSEI